MDDIFIVVINVICAAILIAYVVYKFRKKSKASKEKALEDPYNFGDEMHN